MAEKVKTKGEERERKGEKGERKSLVPLGSLERGRKAEKGEKGETPPEQEKKGEKAENSVQTDMSTKITENMNRIIDLLSFYTTRVLETPCCVDLEDKPLIVCSQVLDNVKKEKEKEKEGSEKKD